MPFWKQSIQEWIDGDKEYWEKEPQKYADNEYYQFYKLPREKWGSRVENYLQIGSDFGAGISKLGIRLNEMSDFLMRSICDVLCCGEYDTAARVLEKMGWIVDEAYQEDFPTLDMDALLKQRSEYGADAVCGCAYDEEKHLLIAAKIDKADSRNRRIMIYRKE